MTSSDTVVDPSMVVRSPMQITATRVVVTAVHRAMRVYVEGADGRHVVVTLGHELALELSDRLTDAVEQQRAIDGGGSRA